MAGPRRIVLLSDGTGNAASKVWRTNVWRVFELLDLTGRDQVAKYDDGVGSSSFKPLALLGGAFGWGLKRNVIDLYKFVCRNYEPDTQIFAFGFSRGAFTARVVVAFILNEGLVPYHSELDLHARAKEAYRAFRADRFKTVFRIEAIFRAIRNVFLWLRHAGYDRSQNRTAPLIEFIGIWDTVAAYGLPIEEMTRGVSRYIWPLYLPERTLDPRVRRACHALSLDDERTTFHPVLWTEKGENPPKPNTDGRVWIKDERLSQVWFAGTHSNVGGGYPDDALAHMPLYWIMQEAAFRGLVFKTPPKTDPDAFLKVASARDPDGRQYDSRAGLGGYYRYGPRKIADIASERVSGSDAVEILLPKIHESALMRLRSDSNAYAPVGIPAKYGVVTLQGELLEGAKNQFETPAQAAARAREQERVWNWVWARRIVYFLTLAASFHLAAFWYFHENIREREFSSDVRLISEFVRLVESFLPRQVVRWWTDWFATNPKSFVVGVGALAGLIWLGSKLGEKITDSMRAIWRERAVQSTIEHSPLPWTIYRFRTSKPYQFIIGVSKRHVLPFLAAVVMVWFGVTVTSHLLFNVFDSTGAFCEESSETVILDKAGAESKPIHFQTSSLCAATQVYVQRGARYSFTFIVPETSPWMDRTIATSPLGFGTRSMPMGLRKLKMTSAVPIRRVLFRPWFIPLARIGAKGNAEIFLDLRPLEGKPNTYSIMTRGVERSGEVFLYVNDAVLPVPWINDLFYQNNKGSAEVVIRRLN